MDFFDRFTFETVRNGKELVSLSVFFDIVKIIYIRDETGFDSVDGFCCNYFLEPNSENPNSQKQKKGTTVMKFMTLY